MRLQFIVVDNIQTSFDSSLDHLDYVGLVGLTALLFLHLLEPSQAFLDTHLQSPGHPFPAVFFVVLFEFPVLVLQFFDFVLLYPEQDVLLLQIFLEEDVVHLVPLLHDDQVIVGVGQLAYIIFELNQLLLHILLVSIQVLLSLLSLLFLGLEIRK